VKVGFGAKGMILYLKGTQELLCLDLVKDLFSSITPESEFSLSLILY